MRLDLTRGYAYFVISGISGKQLTSYYHDNWCNTSNSSAHTTTRGLMIRDIVEDAATSDIFSSVKVSR